MKKTFFCKTLFILFLIFAPVVKAECEGFGAGFEGGMSASFCDENISFLPEAGASLKIETVPLYFYLSCGFNEDGFKSGKFSMEYWISNPRFGSAFVHYFWGPGLNLGIKEGNFAAGLSFALGINFFASYNTEVYLRADPEACIVFSEEKKFVSGTGIFLGVREYF